MLTNSYRKLQRGDIDPKRPEKLEQYISGLERVIDAMTVELDELRARRAGELTFADLLRIKASLEEGGSAQLNLTNLPGIPAETLDTRIPRVSSHPDPYSTPYDTYILTGAPDSLWTINRSTNPPTASQVAFVSNHNLLSSTHTDTVAASVVRGDLIVGNSTPAWVRLARGTAFEVLRVNAGATDLEWGAVDTSVLAPMYGARVFDNGAAQSIADSTDTAITFNSESFDRGSVHSTGSDTSRLTIPTGGDGVWLFFGQLTFAANATGIRRATIRGGGGVTVGQAQENTNSGTQQTVLSVHAVFSVVATDYVELVARQTSGGALNAEMGSGVTWLAGIGPLRLVT